MLHKFKVFKYLIKCLTLFAIVIKKHYYNMEKAMYHNTNIIISIIIIGIGIIIA